ncbi:MAG: M55 family metallopeptidase [Cellulosilyticaceae bacterium]
MKIYISADIEGVTGVSTWREAADVGLFESREQMTREVAAACEGALEAGATEIIIKDAHGEGKNLIHSMLPKEVKILSGWSNHPYNMVEGMNEDFDGVIFIGYHSDALSNASPLAHTLNPTKIKGVWLNEEPASEFTIHAHVASMLGVPTLAVSGDGGLIRKVKEFDEQIQTVVTQEGFGGGIISIHPEVSCEKIKQAISQSIAKLADYKPHHIEAFEMKVAFNHHEDAYKYSFYPGAQQVDPFTVVYTGEDYMELLTFLLFI